MNRSQAPRLKVFLSHASEDKQFVRTLYQKLLQEGAEPWFDEEHLLPGKYLRHEIAEAILHADVVIVCLSKASTRKVGDVQWEMSEALEAASRHPKSEISLIPALIEPCDIPIEFRERQCPSIYEDQGYRKLLEALRNRAASLGRTFSARISLPPPPAADRPAPGTLTPEVVEPYFAEAFIDTFWTRSAPARRGNPFTVSLVGASGVGKTTLAFVLTRASLRQLNRAQPPALPYHYRLALDDSTVVVDHLAWSAGAAPWHEVLSYLDAETDLVLFLVPPDGKADSEAEQAFAQVVRLRTPVVLVANKVDILRGPAAASLRGGLREAFGRVPLPISAGRGIGINSLRKFIEVAPRMYG